jgi:hypothetical protein
MFSKALMRQTINSARTTSVAPMRQFFKVMQQRTAANMTGLRAFATNTAAIEKSI